MNTIGMAQSFMDSARRFVRVKFNKWVPGNRPLKERLINNIVCQQLPGRSASFAHGVDDRALLRFSTNNPEEVGNLNLFLKYNFGDEYDMTAIEDTPSNFARIQDANREHEFWLHGVDNPFSSPKPTAARVETLADGDWVEEPFMLSNPKNVIPLKNYQAPAEEEPLLLQTLKHPQPEHESFMPTPTPQSNKAYDNYQAPVEEEPLLLQTLKQPQPKYESFMPTPIPEEDKAYQGLLDMLIAESDDELPTTVFRLPNRFGGLTAASTSYTSHPRTERFAARP